MYKELFVKTLHNGVYMPAIGLGTWQLPNDGDTTKVCKASMEMGYHLIDTADCYGNQEAIGKAFKQFDPSVRKFEKPLEHELATFQKVSVAQFESNFIVPHGKPSDERKIFVTGKIFTPDFDDDKNMEASYQRFVKQLGRTPDLLLLHWPAGHEGWGDKNRENPENPKIRIRCWRFMESLYHQGKVRAIGVANYMFSHLKPLIDDAKSRADGVVPMVDQIEFSPYVRTDPDLEDLCSKNKIVFTAYSTLGSTQKKSFQNKHIQNISESCKQIKAEPHKLCLRWALQKGYLVIPRTTKVDHAQQNLSVMDFSLPAATMAEIDSCPADSRICPDPHTIV